MGWMQMRAFTSRSLALTSAAATAGAALLVSTAAVSSDFNAANHFKGKTIRIVVDFKAGGGTDIQARYFASNWGKFIPGNPRIEVSNIFPNPAGQNFVWKSKADGLTLSFTASPGIGRELTDPDAKFENERFTQIGAHAARDLVLLARGTLPYNSVLESRGGKVEITVAEPVGRPDDINGKLLAVGLLCMWLDAPLRFVTVARSGTSDTLLMLERGDVNGYVSGSQWYALPRLRPGWMANGFLKPIADMSHPDSPLLTNSETKMSIPNAINWLNEEQKEIWKGLVLPEVVYGKGIVGPPDIPAPIVQALRDAYANAVLDPTFATGLEKIQQQPVALTRGERLAEIMQEYTAAYKKQAPKIQQIQQQVFARYMKGR